MVVLLALNGVAPHATLVDRSAGHAASAVRWRWWRRCCSPVWERELVPTRLADLLDAYRAYLRAARRPATELGRPSAGPGRRPGWRARNAQASVDRARSRAGDRRDAVELGDARAGQLAPVRPRADDRRRRARRRARCRRRCRRWTSCSQADADLLACASGAAGRRAHRAGVTRCARRRSGLHALVATDPARVGGAETAGALVDATDRIANASTPWSSELQTAQPAYARRRNVGQRDRFDDLAAFAALPRLTALALSLDGSRLVATLQQPDSAGARYASSIWEIPLDGGEPVRLDPLGEGRDGAGVPSGRLVAVRLVAPGRADGDKDDDEAALWCLPAAGEPSWCARRPAASAARSSPRDPVRCVLTGSRG